MEIIEGVIRDYDWGHRTALAEILGHQASGGPEAEYWLGAHPGAPSSIASGVQTLDRAIAQDPTATVGEAIAERFGSLPYLLKILAADQPLSIQAHPSLEQARAGFAREEAAGLDRAAPDRNYRDANHKPELICALTLFEAKCGFRPVAESRELIDVLRAGEGDPALDRLADRFEADQARDEAGTLADVMSWLFHLDEDAAAELVAAVRAGASAGTDGPFGRAMSWAVRMSEDFPADPGVVVALLLNHVTLEPGQAVFLEAGNLHSYLSGVGVELMANSDNVLRGGLTSKHVDVAELLDVVDCTPGQAPVQTAVGPVHRFDSPVPEFSLTRFDSTDQAFPEQEFDPAGPDIVLVTSGAVALSTAQRVLELKAGETAFVDRRDGGCRLIDRTPGHTVAWRAAPGDLGNG